MRCPRPYLRRAGRVLRTSLEMAQAQASYVVGSPVPQQRLRLRLVTSQGSPYPSRSPRAHPSGWTRTQGLSHRDSHAPPSFGTTPVRMWNWPLAPLLRRAGNQVVREMPSHTRPSNPGAGSESSDPPRRPLTITRRNGTNGFNGCRAIRRAYESSAGAARVTEGGMPPPPTPPRSRPAPLRDAS